MSLTIGFLLGQAPSASSVLIEAIDLLRRGATPTTTWMWREDQAMPEEMFQADVVALRGLSPVGLTVARRLEAARVRCCNRVGRTALATDKSAVMDALAGAGVAIPATAVVDTWAAARRAAVLRPVVVKTLMGRGGTGVVLADRGGLADAAPFPGPYLVQERIPHRGPDRKVFVIGGHVSGVLRRWPPATLDDKRGRAFDPDPDEVAVATRAGAALGLEVYGVDLVPSDGGPVVVDVNAFPGFKGVTGAGAALAAHLLALADTEAQA